MPSRLEMRTTSQYRQDRGRWYLLDHQVQQFEGRGVCPVQVFQDEQYRLMFGKFLQDRHDSFERFLALSLGRKLQRWICVFRYGQGEQRRKKQYSFLQGQSILAEHLCEFAEFLVRDILSLEPQQPLEQIRERKQCCVLRVLRTQTFPAGMGLRSDML